MDVDVNVDDPTSPIVDANGLQNNGMSEADTR